MKIKKLLLPALFVLLLSQVGFSTVIWITGWEHGVLSANGSSTDGAGLVDIIDGAPSVQGVTVRTGNYAFEWGGAAAQGVRKYGFSNTYLVARLYFRKTATPSGNRSLFIAETSAFTKFLIKISNDGACSAEVQGGGVQTGPAISVDTWYRLDVRMWCGDVNGTLDWQINGAAQTQATNTITASTFNLIEIGDRFNAFGVGESVFVDDIIVSDATGDYPFGAGAVIGISPDADGVHNAGVNTIEDNAGVDINGNAAWDLLDEVPLDAVDDYVRQAAIGAGNYAEVTFANIPSASSVNGAIGVVAYTSADTDANDGETNGFDDDSQETEIYDGDMSETSLFYKATIITLPAGGWDQAQANALEVRVGYSGDVTPNPYWQALMIEVDYVADGNGEAYIPKVIWIKDK